MQETSTLTPTLLAQLEAEPVLSNLQLLAFAIRSRDIDWRRFVQPLDERVRGRVATYLGRQADLVGGRREARISTNRRELFVCHDMMGNYLADRHFHNSEKFDDYRFVHWAAVDYFCYFSHSYITVPPCGWLNAAHRHGVPVLGTYIVEGESGSRQLHEVLTSIVSVDRIVAALIKLCRHYGFEGWLLNIECPVRPEAMANLYYFVRHLKAAVKAEIPNGKVFWYDSVIATGALEWQNEINEKNVKFFHSSDATLINYTWTDASLQTTATTIHNAVAQRQEEEEEQHRAFFGLDVFGRGQVGRFQSGQTMARIAERGFSAGIFAPAWCYETLQQFGYNIHKSDGDANVNAAFLARNESWWGRLWEHLATHSYRSLPFYTDFCVGSGQAQFSRGRPLSNSRPFFNLSRQSLQPSVPINGNAEHSFQVVYSGGNALRVLNYERAFRLFHTEFVMREACVLLVSYAYRMTTTGTTADDLTFDVILRCTRNNNHNQRNDLEMEHIDDQELYIFCGQYERNLMNSESSGMCYLRSLKADELPLELAHPELPSGRLHVDDDDDNNDLYDNWQLRHYLIAITGPLIVRDIGVKCRRLPTSNSYCHLGAINVENVKSSTSVVIPASSIATIPEHIWTSIVK